MKAKLLKEQMGVPAGTEMEVLETGRAWTLRAPSGAEIVVPSCDVEMVPDTEPFSEPKSAFDPKDPSLLVNIFGGQPQPVESEGPSDPETDPAVRDEDGNVVMNEPVEEELDEGPADPFAVVDGDLDGLDDPEPGRTLLDDERDVDAFQEAEPVHEFGSEPAADFDRTLADDDLDEDLPEPQGNCDGEVCESCT